MDGQDIKIYIKTIEDEMFNKSKEIGKLALKRKELIYKYIDALPHKSMEKLTSLFDLMGSIQDLESVQSKAEIRFINQSQKPNYTYKPWETHAYQYLAEKIDEEYSEWDQETSVEVRSNPDSIEREKSELIDLILVSQFLYLKLDSLQKSQTILKDFDKPQEIQERVLDVKTDYPIQRHVNCKDQKCSICHKDMDYLEKYLTYHTGGEKEDHLGQYRKGFDDQGILTETETGWATSDVFDPDNIRSYIDHYKNMNQLDKIIDQQRHNTNIINAIAKPHHPADLQELAEQEGRDD